MKFHSISSRPLLNTSSSCVRPACRGGLGRLFAAAAKGLLELKRWFWVGEAKGERVLGERELGE